MRILPVRALALAILLLLFLSVSGASFAATAFSHAGAADSCCFPSGLDKGAPPATCVIQDCLCLFCLHLPPARLADVSSPPPFAASLFSPLLSHAPVDFIRPIDYPPELA